MNRYSKALLAVVVLCAFLVPALSGEDLVQFDGQLTLPPDTISPRRRVAVFLNGMEAPFSAHTWADSRGRFRFRNLEMGTYTITFYFSDHGHITQTIDLTRSFVGRKGRIEKRFTFDEQSLRALMSSVSESVVSVRELSIPNKAMGEYQKAQARLERHDARGAIRHLEKAVALAPQFMEALNNLGTIHFRLSAYSKAEHYFRQALEQDPQAYEPLVNLGGALLALGRAREALAINLHAQNARPKDPLANSQLGLSYFSLGEYDRAIAYLETAQKLDPGHFSHPQIPLAEIHLRLANAPAALRELRNFLNVHPDSPRSEGVRATIEKIEAGQGTLTLPDSRDHLPGSCPP